MTETEQMELPLAVQPSEFKQMEFPWRVLANRKALPKKRVVGSGAKSVRSTEQVPTLNL